MSAQGIGHTLLLGLRQFYREIHATEVRVLFLAVLIAVATSTSIGYFGARLSASMQQQASEFLGADLILNGNAPASVEQLKTGQALGLSHARVVEFSSVIATDEHLQLSSIKAVDSAYPLRGELRSAAAPYQPEQAGGAPKPGELWAEARLLAALSLQVGDSVDVGYLKLRLTRVLTHEPDRPDDLYSLMPRVLIHLDDLPATGIIQPGSQVRYRELWKGSSTALASYREYLEPSLTASQRLESIRDGGNNRISRALERAEHYLGLASLIAILLSGIAVALAAARFANRRLDACALLRCLGLSSRKALQLYAIQLGALGMLASLAGAVLGWGIQQGLFFILSDILAIELQAADIWPALLGMATGLVMLIGFALPPLAALGRVPPLRVLRRDVLPIPSSRWMVQGAALLALTVIMWQLSLDGRLTSILMGGAALIALLLGSLLKFGLNALRKPLEHAPLHWRLGFGQLLRHPLTAIGQILAFGLILLTMALVALLRLELVDTWRSQLPENAANHFAINILPDEQQAFQQHLTRLTGQPQHLYPVVRGRLISINGKPAKDQAIKDSQGERAVRRDLNLTWAATLPSDNRLLAGHWWRETASAATTVSGVSVDAKLAESLGIQLGDHLTFDFGDAQREAQVSSLRAVNWDNLQPNFYMIFEPGALDGITRTFLASFHLAAGQDRALVQLNRAFPSVTLIPVDDLLARLQGILAQVSLAVECVLLLVLAAGLTVLFAGLLATLDERIRQTAVLRALGARRSLLQKTRVAEFALLGAASGLMAALGCELVSALLYTRVFDIPWQPHPWLLGLPILGALLISAAGLLGTQKALKTSPLILLREG